MDRWSQFLEPDNEEPEEQLNTRSAIIFVLDAKHHHLLSDLIQYMDYSIKNSSDKMGVLLYRTRESNNLNSVPGLYTLLQVDDPDIVKLKEIQNLDFNTIGTTDTYSIRDCFNECQLMFKKAKKLKKYVYFITEESNPYQNQNLERTAVILKSMDLVHAQVSLHIIGIEKDQEFNFDSFYKQLNYFKFAFDEGERFEVVKSGQGIMDVLVTRDANHRTAFSGLFLVDGIEVGVRGYRQYVEKKKASYKALDPITNAPLLTKTIYMDALINKSSAKELQRDEIAYSFSFGDAPAVFEKEELVKIRLAQSQPEMKLMGFKASEFLKDYYSVKPSLFMVADESTPGSTAFLGKLVQRLQSKNVVAICSLVMRKNSSKQLVALMACTQPSIGFHVIPLPFADDIRDIPTPAIEHINEQHIEAFSSIVQPLIAPFDPTKIENPVLAKQYAYLHAMAMGNEDLDFKDGTVPPYEMIVQKVGPLIRDFNQSTMEIAPPPVETVKPARSQSGEAKSTKRKAEDLFQDDEIREAIESGTLKKYTVAQLTDIIKQKNGKIKSKKKSDLMELVVELFKP